MYVARLQCGCVAAAWLGNNTDPELGTAIKEWQGKGYVVKNEKRDSVGAEKCEKHKTLLFPSV